MMARAWGIVAVAVVSAVIPLSTATAQVDVAATLSVLSEPVDRIATRSGAVEPGYNGMNLVEGDRVRAGAGGVALITFLDGTTVTVLWSISRRTRTATVRPSRASRSACVSARMKFVVNRRQDSLISRSLMAVAVWWRVSPLSISAK